MITLQERVHAAPKPDDWQLDKLHQVFRVRRGHKNAGMKEDNLLSLSYGRIIQKDIQTADGLLPENFEGYQIVEPGNIVLRLTDLQNDKRSLRQGLVTQRGIITSAYDAVEVQRDNDPRFWFYSLLALDLAKHYYSLGGGVRQSVKFADFPNDWVYRPYLATQRQIADFLDRETARIDLLIEKKQRLVALLGERNNVARSEHLKRLRDQHGERKLSHVCLIQRGRFNYRPRNAEELYDGEFPFLQTGDVAQAKKFITDHKQTLSGLGASISKKFKKGTVLMAIAANVGNVAILKFDAFCPDSVVGFLPERKIDTEFLYYVLRGAGEEIATSSTSNAQDNTNIARLSALKIPMPSKEKQIEVAAQFAREEQREIRLSEQTNTSIDRLKEYRSALITAAVTGQIDVSTYAKSGTPDRRLDAIQEEMGA